MKWLTDKIIYKRSSLKKKIVLLKFHYNILEADCKFVIKIWWSRRVTTAIEMAKRRYQFEKILSLTPWKNRKVIFVLPISHFRHHFHRVQFRRYRLTKNMYLRLRSSFFSTEKSDFKSTNFNLFRKYATADHFVPPGDDFVFYAKCN